MSSVGQLIAELASALGNPSQAQFMCDRLNKIYGTWSIGGGGIQSDGVCVLPRHLYQAFLAGTFPESFVVKKPRHQAKAAPPPEPLADLPVPSGDVLTFDEWQDKRRKDDTKKVTKKAKKKASAKKKPSKILGKKKPVRRKKK
jgi:hypothetical protein